MKLSSLLDPQRKLVKIDDIELWFKKLTWKELTDFQKFAKENEDDSEEESAVKLCEHILEKFVTDEEGDKVVETKQVKDLPVEFCLKVVEKFLATTRGDSEEDTKKK